jgi:diguanylate cyclase (GGDEF)-like protein
MRSRSLAMTSESESPHRARVLLVEDSPVSLRVYSQQLGKRGYLVSTAASAAEAKSLLDKAVPDLVLLDIFMPDVSGFELLSDLRADPRTARVPVILISALSEADHVVEGLELGANDYVTKPIVLPVLIARMEALLRASDLVRKLEVQTELLAKLAAYDELTGAYNRRSMFHHLEAERARSQRYGRCLSVLMVDVDHFKRVNDEHGHRAGDQVLAWFSQLLVGQLRSMDFVCRYGGEEFCVLLPETPAEGALKVAERLRVAAERSPFTSAGLSLTVTASIGVATWDPAAARDVPDLLLRADSALLEAKRAGRNQVRVAT